MVGAGVLGLPSTLSTLGWAGGLIMITATFWMSWYTYKLLVSGILWGLIRHGCCSTMFGALLQAMEPAV